MLSFSDLLDVSPSRLATLATGEVEVAIIDSGIDGSHPDLTGRIASAHSIVSDKTNFQTVGMIPTANNDLCGHATGVASLVSRIAPRAHLIDVRILNEDGTIDGKGLVEGFRHAIARGCQVINLSLASTAAFAAPLTELCEIAYDNRQIVVAAMRNMPLSGPSFPAELSSCIGVDSVSKPSLLLIDYLSQYKVEFAASGIDVVVAVPGGGYAARSGTSFATPIVSGLCALLKGANPTLTPFEVKAILKNMATLIGSHTKAANSRN